MRLRPAAANAFCADKVVQPSRVPSVRATYVVCNTLRVDPLPRITLTGALEGNYIVLAEQAKGHFKIAPEPSGERPRIVTLERTTLACPTQWVATLADGRTVYARSRHGEFSVGVGTDLDDAILKSSGPEALYFDYVGDGPMGFDQLRGHLCGLLEFPPDLSVGSTEIGALD